MVVIFDRCACCGRSDGLNTGGCYHCAVRTTCACGCVLACGCGRAVTAHACPCVVPASTGVGTVVPASTVEVVGTVEPVPTLPGVA